MDNLTHSLTGLALSRAGLHRWYARPALLLIIAANIPDIDILAASGGSLTYFHDHRGLTHSFLMAPVMAMISVLLVCAIGRTMQGWKQAWCISMIAVASHLLLDWTNAYGVRFLWPFSNEWFRLDLNNIVDIWIWAVLLLAAVGPLIGRLVSSEMGGKPGSGRGLAWFALLFLLTYDFGRYLLHQRALDTLNSRVYRGGAPLHVAAFPVTVANPLAWDGWIARPDFDMQFALNLRGEFDATSGKVFYKPEPGPALDAARKTDAMQKFLEFAQYPLWRVLPVSDPEGARRVEVRDWRFPFTAWAVVDGSNRVLSSGFHF